MGVPQTTETRASLCRRASQSAGRPPAETRRVLDEMLALIAGVLCEGAPVTLHGFGAFRRVHKATKLARNIIVGATVSVPAHQRIQFRPSRKLRTSVDQGAAGKLSADPQTGSGAT